MVSRIGHVALCVRDLDAAIFHAVEILGLREVERGGGTAYLTCDTTHHGLQLIASDEVALDHTGFEVPGSDGLASVREMLDREQIPVVSDGPREAGIRDSVRFAGTRRARLRDLRRHGKCGASTRRWRYSSGQASAHHVQVRRDGRDGAPLRPARFPAVRPDRRRARLDAMQPGSPRGRLHQGRGRLHHYAWEVESWADLERLGDHLLAHGKRFMFGPGQHGPGLNLFCYHLDGAGVLVEYTADLQRIYDEAGYEPRTWPDTPESINQWGPAAPEAFMTQLTPTASTTRSSG